MDYPGHHPRIELNVPLIGCVLASEVSPSVDSPPSLAATLNRKWMTVAARNLLDANGGQWCGFWWWKERISKEKTMLSTKIHTVSHHAGGSLVGQRVGWWWGLVGPYGWEPP